MINDYLERTKERNLRKQKKYFQRGERVAYYNYETSEITLWASDTETVVFKVNYGQYLKIKRGNPPVTVMLL